MNPLVGLENFSALADQQTNIPIWFPNILDYNYILPTSDRICTVLSQLATTGCKQEGVVDKIPLPVWAKNEENCWDDRDRWQRGAEVLMIERRVKLRYMTKDDAAERKNRKYLQNDKIMNIVALKWSNIIIFDSDDFLLSPTWFIPVSELECRQCWWGHSRLECYCCVVLSWEGS